MSTFPSAPHVPDIFDRDDFADEPASRPNPAQWPPALNAFGMIGQHTLVGALEERIAYAKHRDTRLSDVILCGLPGGGKSTIARAIARLIAEGHCLALNGADIESPKAFVKAIGDHGLFGDPEDGAYPLERSILFIDEAHALKKRVVAWLLSALDDARTTSHDGKRYSFHRATFILATTDPGKLPETFRTRAETVYLKPYTLDEVAGIVCTHGQSGLEGAALPFAVCEEIAARVRANPRRAVRALLQALIPHAFVRLQQGGINSPSPADIADALTVELVAAYFDSIGVDVNGLDDSARSLLQYLRENGAVPESRLCQALSISNRNDFLALDEYLGRLGLIAVSTRGRELTAAGRRYVSRPVAVRQRISNAARTAP